MATLIHLTHEACQKMGGIGAVLEGLLTSRSYQAAVDRTILIGTADLPCRAPPDDLHTILYGPDSPASADLAPELAAAFGRIEEATGVRILYGHRAVFCPLETRRTEVELLVMDVRKALPGPINETKRRLWEAYGLQSDRFERDWGFEEWIRVAAPALEAAQALLGGDLNNAALISHEFMGLPTLLLARRQSPDLRTIYWAHEVPTIRDMIEQRSEHRMIFDRALETNSGLHSYETMLRDWGGYKHALVSRAHAAHHIFAVSDRIARELELLAPDFRRTPVDVVYNGLPVRPIDLETRLASRDILRRYAETVVGFRPDYVFTHVARPVASKAIERDLAVMEHLDDILADRGQTAVLLVLATDGGRRDRELVQHMEAEYGWPLNHHLGWPDLVKGEVPIGQAAEQYNGWARGSRVVLINQFGFNRQTCGDRMPEEATFQDLRQGSDAEFGQSAYEPFGIAQLETLAFGGISVISRACGCAQLLARVAGHRMPPNVLLANYGVPEGIPQEAMTGADCRRIEHEVAARLARELADRLPKTRRDFADLLASGWKVAEKMSWQAVCKSYFVPALERCMGRPLRRSPKSHTHRA
jgi:glycosyltransferase involved in cell wall biosynthesis